MNPSASFVTPALLDAAISALDGVAVRPDDIARNLAKYAWDQKHADGQKDVDACFFDLMGALGADDQDFCKVYRAVSLNA